MTWTGAKKTAVARVIVLLVVAITIIGVKEFISSPVNDSFWENLTLTNGLQSAPPALIIRPTHFPDAPGFSTSVFESRFAGENDDLSSALEYAYGMPRARMIIPGELQERIHQERLDFLVTVPDQPREKFQAEIQKKFGLTIRRQVRDTDALLLTIKNPDAPGLKTKGAIAFPLTNYVWMMTGFFGAPVIDQTGLKGIYNFSPKLTGHNLTAGREAYKQALLDQLGLELVPTNMPVEMLIIERAK